MQFLQEIIGLSYFHFYPQMELFSPSGVKNERLYRAIRDGEVTTDQEARQLIYGDQTGTKKYTMLKQRLKIQLIDHYYELLSQTDSGELLPALKYRLDYLKNLAVVHTLIRRGRYALAQQLLNHHQRSAEAQFDLQAVQEGIDLQHQLASYQGKQTTGEGYYVQQQRASRQAEALRLARGHYHTLRPEHRRRLAPSADVAEQARAFAREVQQRQRQTPHPAVGFYGRHLRLMAHLHRGDGTRFRRTLFFQQQHLRRHPALRDLDPVANADRLAMQYRSTAHQDDQSELVQQTITWSRDESLPVVAWLILREVECLHWLQRGDYQQAGQVCEQLAGEEDTLIVASYERARWALYQTYVAYLERRASSAESDGPTDGHPSVSLATLEARVQPLLTDPGYGWQWFLLKTLLWLEYPFVKRSHYLSQIEAYAQRHLANQTERGAYFYRQLYARVSQPKRGRKVVPPSADRPWPLPTERDRLQEIVPYEQLEAAASGSNL
jgi:hypothetical protein